MVKLADVEPAGTVTLGGSCTRPLLPESDTTAPPAGAPAVSITAPVEFDPPVTVAGFSVSDCSSAVGGGGAALTVNVSALESAVPGFATVTCLFPSVVMSEEGIDARTCVAESTVVVLDEPFHFTTAPDTNPDPVTVSVNAGPPAVAVLG